MGKHMAVLINPCCRVHPISGFWR